MGNSSLDNKNCGDSSEKIIKISTENCNESKLVTEAACEPINAAVINDGENIEMENASVINPICDPLNHAVKDESGDDHNDPEESINAVSITANGEAINEEVINQSEALVGHLSNDEGNSCEEDCPSIRDETDKDEEKGSSSDDIGWPSSEGADEDIFVFLNDYNPNYSKEECEEKIGENNVNTPLSDVSASLLSLSCDDSGEGVNIPAHSSEDALIMSVNPFGLFEISSDSDSINIPSSGDFTKTASIVNPPLAAADQRDQLKDPMTVKFGEFILTSPASVLLPSRDISRLPDGDRLIRDCPSQLAESLQLAEAEIMDASLSQVICKARDLLAEARDLLDEEAEDISDEDEVASPLDIDMADLSSLESLSLVNENCLENVLMMNEVDEEDEIVSRVTARRQSVKQDHPYASLLQGSSAKLNSATALSEITKEMGEVISETIAKSSEPLSIESAKIYNDVFADICPHLNFVKPGHGQTVNLPPKSSAASQSNEVFIQAVTSSDGNLTITHKKETSAPPPPSISLSVPSKPTASRTYSKSAPSASSSGKLRANKLNVPKNLLSTSPRSAVSKALNSVAKHSCGHARTVGKVMVTQSSSTKTIVTNVPLPTKSQVESAIKKAVSPAPTAASTNSKPSTSVQATTRPCGHVCSKSTDTSSSSSSSTASSPPAPPPSPTTSVNKAFTATASTAATPSKPVATPTKPLATPSKATPRKPETADASTGTEESQPVNCHVTKYSHSWTITNFSKKMKMGNGKSIDSMCFSIPVRGKKTDWSMLLYPNGDKEKVNGSVSLYLTCKHRKGLAMSLEFRFTILDLDGNKKTAPTKSGSITAAMLQTNSSWGWEAFVKQDELMQHNLLPNDRLTVHCDMTLKCLEPEVKPVLPTEIDKRDIDKLVDFVGEISSKSEKLKKKKKKSTSKASALSTEPTLQPQNEELDSTNISTLKATKSMDSAPDKPPTKVSAPKTKSQSSTALNNIVNDAEIKEFQVVTRRRGRKNSQSNSNSQKSDGSETPKMTVKSATKTTPRAKSLSGSSIGNAPRVKTLSESTNIKVAKAPSDISVNNRANRRTPELKDITIQMNNLQIDAEERHESVEDLVCTAGMLESNISKIKELEAEKTAQIVKITMDKNNKMDAIAASQAELKLRTNMLEKRKMDLEAALVDTVSEISEIEILFKRTSDKGGRLTMYLSEHLRDAEKELARLGQEKGGLEAKMGVVQAKIESVRDKQSAVGHREELQLLNSQIGRLETNLECPICLETAATPIYQCAEGHLVCSSCEVRVGQCAVCRQATQGKSIRNRYAEKDSEELRRLIRERSKLF